MAGIRAVVTVGHGTRWVGRTRLAWRGGQIMLRLALAVLEHSVFNPLACALCVSNGGDSSDSYSKACAL